MANEPRKQYVRQDAFDRLDELLTEAERTKSSAKLVVEVSVSKGVIQTVQDERRRY